MKGKNSKEKTVVKTEEKPESKIKEKEKRCGLCKWYDVSTERPYVRFLGPDKHEVEETRAICKNSRARAFHHRVNTNSVKDCFERGTYKAPEKKDVKGKETKKVEKPTEEKMTSPEEYFGTPEDRLKKQRRSRK